jgi:hypothetical protein
MKRATLFTVLLWSRVTEESRRHNLACIIFLIVLLAAACLFLIPRVKWPEWLFPFSGKWLRRFLVGAVLGGLIIALLILLVPIFH